MYSTAVHSSSYIPLYFGSKFHIWLHVEEWEAALFQYLGMWRMVKHFLPPNNTAADINEFKFWNWIKWYVGLGLTCKLMQRIETINHFIFSSELLTNCLNPSTKGALYIILFPNILGNHCFVWNFSNKNIKKSAKIDNNSYKQRESSVNVLINLLSSRRSLC